MKRGFYRREMTDKYQRWNQTTARRPTTEQPKYEETRVSEGGAGKTIWKNAQM